jgi:hypothetical protein
MDSPIEKHRGRNLKNQHAALALGLLKDFIENAAASMLVFLCGVGVFRMTLFWFPAKYEDVDAVLTMTVVITVALLGVFINRIKKQRDIEIEQQGRVLLDAEAAGAQTPDAPRPLRNRAVLLLLLGARATSQIVLLRFFLVERERIERERIERERIERERIEKIERSRNNENVEEQLNLLKAGGIGF